MRIFFVHNHLTRFVQMDLELLRERYTVREWYQKSRVVNLAALVQAIWQSDLIFGWFASWHTFFPMLFAQTLRKPSVLVVGGYDTANMPEIGYGSQRGGFKKWISRTTMQQATRLITNSNYTRNEAARNTGIAIEKISAIYHGLENQPAPTHAKENLVITVGNVDQDNLQRKGLELFVRAAALCPENRYVIIGAWRDDAIEYLRALASPNVKFTDWVADDELHDYFSRAQVYVQASRHEGFGLAVAEAMLCECVPVVTRVGSLPEVVGDAGVYVDSFEPSALAEGVHRAFAVVETIGPRARILREFPLEKRREKLFELIDSLISKDGSLLTADQ